MALHEIVLRRNEFDEIRFTDHEPELGSTFAIDGRSWIVEEIERSSHPFAATRFICRDDGKGSPTHQ